MAITLEGVKKKYSKYSYNADTGMGKRFNAFQKEVKSRKRFKSGYKHVYGRGLKNKKKHSKRHWGY